MKKAALNVFAEGVPVGRLDRSDREEDEILFTYHADCTPQRAVSLTMPVRVDQYDAMGGLLPIFAGCLGTSIPQNTFSGASGFIFQL